MERKESSHTEGRFTAGAEIEEAGYRGVSDRGRRLSRRTDIEDVGYRGG